MTENKGKIEELLKKPYSRVLIPDAETGTYTAIIKEFPGCITEGSTPEEAYRRLEETACAWLDSALALGQKIAPPLAENIYSGKLVLRLPRSFHRRAAELAGEEGVSLNQWIVAAIAQTIGTARATNVAKEKGAQVSAADLGAHAGTAAAGTPVRVAVGETVREAEKRLILRTLAEVDGNRTRAAEILGISVRTMRNKLREYREEGEDIPGD